MSFERGSGCPSTVDIDLVNKRDADEYGVATTLTGLGVTRTLGASGHGCDGTVALPELKVGTDERYTLKVVNSVTGETKFCGEWYMVDSYFGDADWKLSLEDCWAGHDELPRHTDHQ